MLKRIILLMACCLLTGTSVAQSFSNPKETLGEGWQYIDTDEPCIAVLGKRCQIRNERGKYQMFFVTLSNEELGFTASYRIDLPATGIIVGNMPELGDADMIRCTEITGNYITGEHKIGVRSKVPHRDDSYFSSFKGITGHAATGLSMNNSWLAYQLQHSGSFEDSPGSASTHFAPEIESAPDWWISPEQIAELVEQGG